jgi:hypothetical protein
MGTELMPKISATLVTVAAAAATATSAAFAIPAVADCWSFYLNVTSAGGTTETLDVVFKTSVDGGTTYVNIPWRFSQVTTSAVSKILTVRNGFAIGQIGWESITAPTGGTLAKPCVIDPNFMKITYTIAGTNPLYDFKLYVITLPANFYRQNN